MQPDQVLKNGTVLKSPNREYKVVGVLGQGGFGITYLVESTAKVGYITVAVKLALKEHFIGALCERGDDSLTVSFSQPVAQNVLKSRSAFIKEASRVKNLGIDHHNIVRIDEVFEANNTAYYVMEYLEGQTLAKYVERKGALGYDEALEIMRPIILAMGELHRSHLTHYDIKPHNIILATGQRGEMRPVLIDFGLAKHYDGRGDATSTLGPVGFSKGYAPVEQYSGLEKFTPQADVYAMGATLLFCLTGHKPADAFDFDVDSAIANLPEMIPQSGRDVLLKAMQMHKKNRYRDAGEFAEALFGYSATENKNETPPANDDSTEIGSDQAQGVYYPDPEPIEPPMPPTRDRDRKLSRWLLIGFVVVLIIILALLLLPSKREDGGRGQETDNQDAFFTENLITPEMVRAFNEDYNDAGSFSEGLLSVGIYRDNGEYKMYGYMDRHGNTVIPPQFRDVGNFSEGLAAVSLDGKKYGFINKEGEVVIPFKYDFVHHPFEEGYSVVSINDKFGVIDKEGHVVIPFEYENMGNIGSGVFPAWVKNGRNEERAGFLDIHGEWVIPPKYAYTYPFSGGVAEVTKEGGGHYFINRQDEIVAGPYRQAQMFNEGFAVVYIGTDKYGFINDRGKMINKDLYDWAHDFSEGFAWVERDGVNGFIDKRGEMVITGPYTGTTDFHSGLAGVNSGGKYGFIDSHGEVAIPFEFDDGGHFSEGFAVVRKNGKLGLVDIHGNSTFD